MYVCLCVLMLESHPTKKKCFPLLPGNAVSRHLREGSAARFRRSTGFTAGPVYVLRSVLQSCGCRFPWVASTHIPESCHVWIQTGHHGGKQQVIDCSRDPGS